MASTQDYLEFVLDLLSEVSEVTHRKMMGEYILYSRGVIFGGIYDDRFLLKDVPATRKAFATEQIPYDGAKPMLLVDSEDPIRIAQQCSHSSQNLKSRSYGKPNEMDFSYLLDASGRGAPVLNLPH